MVLRRSVGVSLSPSDITGADDWRMVTLRLVYLQLYVHGLGIFSLPFVRLGLDLFSVRNSPGIFCFLLGFSAVIRVGGGSLVMAEGLMEHGGADLCGGFSFDDVFYVVVLRVGVQILCGLHCACYAHDFNVVAGLAANELASKAWRIGAFTGDVFIGFWYLQGVFFVRFIVHLPLVGAGVHGSPSWDCCLLAGDCWRYVWHLFPVMMGIARGIQRSNSTSCY